MEGKVEIFCSRYKIEPRTPNMIELRVRLNQGDPESWKSICIDKSENHPEEKMLPWILNKLRKCEDDLDETTQRQFYPVKNQNPVFNPEFCIEDFHRLSNAKKLRNRKTTLYQYASVFDVKLL